ncbi:MULTISPECIES: SgcJ/EcaC family oxidoreductase [unclassified Streptomyces]|uniref:SgcJ/EcaC family oxidoreductase n=1 Tax=unclassified Streptomyces TaxID=2593676 RepID=UPI002E2F5DA8|nr:MULTISPECIES: SgcJ/EcaC family oxidoreductase [unclassified Streptomyces]WUC63053.1 SgcJ/EcaC family oxidoreductase [Streptomyces sp. NBC_00539]
MTIQQPARPEETHAVHALLRRSAAAWAAGDGAAYGDCFTEDATDVTYVGTLYRGGAEIGRAHQALFDSFLKGTRLDLDVVDLRFHGPHTAVAVTRGAVRKQAAKPGRLGKVATYVIVRGAAGRWRVAAVQKTARRPLMEAFSFRAQPATRPAAG